MKRHLGRITLLILSGSSAQAELLSRMEGQAYYDDVFDITWLANSNLAATDTFGVTGICTENGAPCSGAGTMSWAKANEWIAAMNTVNHLGVSDWRLPTTTQPDPSCDSQYDPGPPYSLQGYGSHCIGSEMGQLANIDAITRDEPGPFAIVFDGVYWSATTQAYDPSMAWAFRFISGGDQGGYVKDEDYSHAWAVRTGDIDADEDGIAQPQDNCTLAANLSQLDTDGDGYGNLCDGDLNQSGLTTANDFALLRSCLNLAAETSALCAAADMNGSGLVTSLDFSLLRARLNTAPGPSGLHP